ncbi:MAG TPA: tetratricopeptide repeat protein [Candidatus Bathyarchaeia archaeon]|nr:tetratricopeptide repeat protein [Candidatus Bathyarchaeia archaeon]
MDLAQLDQQAIKAAIENNWEKAQKINQEIVKKDPDNLSALNRLARAWVELGKISRAQKTYRKVLLLDADNPIATKNLEKLAKTGQSKKGLTPKKRSVTLRDIFLEESGKTKVIKLVKLAGAPTLSFQDNADPVLLVPKKRKVSVTTEEGTYLGSIPDDLSQRLIRLIQGGNRYEAYVKAVEKGEMQIFIREVFRSQKFKNLPSFTPSGSSYSAYLDPKTFYQEKPEIAPTGEEEELES